MADSFTNVNALVTRPEPYSQEEVSTMKTNINELLAPPREGGVQVIKRVAAILRAVKATPSGLSVAELARLVALPRSTVYRIVKTLVDDEFLTVGPDRQGVRLGPELAQLVLSTRRSLADVALPHMVRVARDLNETVDLAVWQNDQVRFIDQVVSGHRLRAEMVIGESFPAYCTANGKVFLAALSPSSLEAYFANNALKRLTPKTIVSRTRLTKQLKEVREQGYALDLEEHGLQICAVGTLVHDARDGATAALTIVAPAYRFYGREHVVIEAIREATRQIEESLAQS